MYKLLALGINRACIDTNSPFSRLCAVFTAIDQHQPHPLSCSLPSLETYPCGMLCDKTCVCLACANLLATAASSPLAPSIVLISISPVGEPPPPLPPPPPAPPPPPDLAGCGASGGSNGLTPGKSAASRPYSSASPGRFLGAVRIDGEGGTVDAGLCARSATAARYARFAWRLRRHLYDSYQFCPRCRFRTDKG